MNEQDIIKKYNTLLSNGKNNLLPLNKIITLEKAKEDITECFLKKIITINSENSLLFSEHLDENALKEECIKKFGFINYYDKKIENTGVTIVYIFDLAQITISSVNNLVKYKVTIYWDT